MAMKIVWLKKSESQVIRTANYILIKFGETSKQKFVEKVYRIVELLRDNPEIGRIEPLLADRVITYRSIIVNKINKIVYRIKDNETIEIAAFWNLRREPKFLANQVKN